jgi:beta-N-acetylhexosaminidase
VTRPRLVVGFEGTALPEAVRALALEGLIAGVVLFRRNLESPGQLRALIDAIISIFEGCPTPIIAIDQEGGLVQRLKEPAFPVPVIPAMGTLAHLDEAGFERLGEAMGKDLRRFGFNLDFAPVMDVDTNPDNPIIGARAFGKTPEDVITRGLAFARGLASASVAWCAKHFPGHGDTSQDSHLTLPRVDHPRARMDAVELPPFAAAVRADAPAIMTAHVLFPELDTERPATLSPAIVPPLLRGTMGYDGVVISDDLDMLAIRDRFSVAEVAAGLAAADVDLALVCRDLDFARALAERLPPSPRADARILALREALARPEMRSS